jgi:hypothetical protein
MKKICCAIAIGSLCSLSGMAATQDPEKKLTKAEIEDAARDLKGVRIALWDHSGVLSEGSALWITGDGAVETAWNESCPLAPGERYCLRKLRLALSADEVRKIVRLFADDDVLALPKIRKDLLGVRETRVTIGMSVAGVGAFDGEHPNLEWSKLPNVPAAGTLIKALRSSVQTLQARIAKEDEEFLTKERLAKLIDAGEAKLVLELRDIQGLWGGRSVRIRSDGGVEGVHVDVPKQGQSGMQIRYMRGSVAKDRAAAILKDCVESGTFDLQSERRHGIPDEAHPALEIRATVDGATYSRSIGMWEGQVREHPAFGKVRKALLDLPVEPVKKTSK